MKHSGKNLLLTLAVAVVVTACTSIPQIPTAAEREAVYARSETVFANAILLKPRPQTNSAEATALAPLLVREAGPAATPTVVYFAESETVIAGKHLRQMAYLWDDTSARARRGVRLTLNLDGAPVIWEILEPSSAIRQIIVCQSLETAAREAFGAVVAGRRFAVEAEVAGAPAVVVARVIEDGPAVMGPMVQVDAQGRVVSVYCRCMPTPSRAVGGEGNFELRPLSGRLYAQPLDSVLRLPARYFHGVPAIGG